MWRTAKDFAVYLFIRGAIVVIQALPLSACERGAEILATLFANIVRLRGSVVDKNLRIAFPGMTSEERDEVTWQMWRHLILMIAEIAQTPRKVHETNWREHSHIVNQEQFVRTLLSGRPLVLISGHFGNFELGGYLMGLFGFPTYTVARTLDNRFLDRFVNDFRGRTGQFMLPKKGSGEDIQRLLENNGILTLLGDQAAGDKQCWVDFFGKPASTHKAVSVFSLTNNAPTMVSYARRVGGPLHYEVGPAAICDPQDPNFEFGSIPLLAQWYTDHLERLVRESPDQYWWVHRRWKGEPPARKKRDLESKREVA
ncbi:MAG TPA: lysophospholipid acyltransferase family protein [Lacipirellulaceae bacterium]|jgi:KDO2-lipid IV(A) lauroyltransferase|nr:lysophospholipid acyltransferase family protein [Lacipirellulaceae bacterium]